VGGGERSGAKEARFVAGLAASASPPRFRLELISVHQLWKSLVPSRPFNARDRHAVATLRLGGSGSGNPECCKQVSTMRAPGCYSSSSSSRKWLLKSKRIPHPLGTPSGSIQFHEFFDTDLSAATTPKCFPQNAAGIRL
jgi:hypothetical protein